MSRDLEVEGLFNVRDLGGLPRSVGGVTPSGVFVRSDQPDVVTDPGWEVLRARGVRAVVDLRQPGERSAARARVPEDIADLHFDHDGLEQEAEFWDGYWRNGLVTTPVYYLPHVTRLPARTAAVLEVVATAPEGGVLLHCVAGRDRTGIISAVLLRIAGVDDEAIVADYLESVANEKRLAAGRERPDRTAEIAALLAAKGTTVEAAFREFLSKLDIGPILDLLPPDESHAIRSWRGALDPAEQCAATESSRSFGPGWTTHARGSRRSGRR